MAGASAAPAANEPYWFIPSPELPAPIPGVDMRTGAEIGFFGPTTNTNNIAGAQRHNFLTDPSETIERPSFTSVGTLPDGYARSAPLPCLRSDRAKRPTVNLSGGHQSARTAPMAKQPQLIHVAIN